tara:strand:+ start:20174 stop:20746 length:573 start_codon:yes stop_codon:yes gene_type:complete
MKGLEEYDLSSKKDDASLPNKAYKSKVYSEEEITRILADYIEVPISKWKTLRYGQKISYYMKEDNFFKFGGYINTIAENKEQTDNYYILRGNLRKTSKSNWQWTVPMSKLAKVFICVGPEYDFITKKTKDSERKLRRELIETIDSLVEHINKLRARVKILERVNKANDDTRTVTSRGSGLRNIKDDVSSL